jgi:exodeoxyribonuclease VII small subunit
MTDPQTPADIARLGFEDALKELEEIVRALEQGKGKLEDAIRSYERGAALKAHCERKLAEAEARIERIALGADGVPRVEPARLG